MSNGKKIKLLKTDRPDTVVVRFDEPQTGGVAVDCLRSIIERVERLEDERKALAEDIRDIFTEAKSAGFDVAAVKEILKIRKKNPADVAEQEMLVDTYRRALGL